MNYLDSVKLQTFVELCAKATRAEASNQIRTAIRALDQALQILISARVPTDRSEVQLLKARIQVLKDYTGPVARTPRKPLKLAVSPPRLPVKKATDELKETLSDLDSFIDGVRKDERIKERIKRQDLQLIPGKKHDGGPETKRQ